MPVVVSSTLPCVGTPMPSKRRSAKAPEGVLEIIEYELIEPCELIPQVEVSGRRRDEDSATHKVETVVCGYRIGPLLARGGMSVVFEVTHPHPRCSGPLAMKVITDQRLQDDLAADAICAHAEAIAALPSRSIVRTLDAGRLPSGEPFVVMERLDGEDLEERLKDRGPLPFAEAIRFVIQACDGLAHAHAAGIVHGDLKPGNLVIARERDGTAQLKIIDFAPAVPRASDPADPLVTCSPGYAAPEQLGARRDVDGRADVWALGAVLYELVTGRRAFAATTLADMFKVIGRLPPTVRSTRSDAPAALDVIIARCLVRDREGRYADVLLLRDALVALEANHASHLRFVKDTEASARPAATLPARAMRDVAFAARPRRSLSLGRCLFLTALGPVSALVSMTLVRFLMASSPMADRPPPAKWPAPAPLAPTPSMATR